MRAKAQGREDGTCVSADFDVAGAKNNVPHWRTDLHNVCVRSSTAAGLDQGSRNPCRRGPPRDPGMPAKQRKCCAIGRVELEGPFIASAGVWDHIGHQVSHRDIQSHLALESLVQILDYLCSCKTTESPQLRSSRTLPHLPSKAWISALPVTCRVPPPATSPPGRSGARPHTSMQRAQKTELSAGARSYIDIIIAFCRNPNSYPATRHLY